MEYNEYKPCRHLAPYVECYWSACADRPPFREQESLIPDGTIELMFNFGDDYSQIIDNQKRVVKGSHIIGIRRQSLVISQTCRQDFFCIRFKPGGCFPVFNIPAHEFSNGFYQIRELFDHELDTLEQQLYEAETNRERVELTEHYLMGKLGDDLRDYRFVQACCRALLYDPSNGVGAVADQFNTSYKTIERKFLDVVGLTPSRLLTIKQFNLAVHTMYSCSYDSLTEVAHACGYYDQSHFIRKFKQLTNLTPGAFLKQQFTIVKVIQPALAERLSKSYNFS